MSWTYDTPSVNGGSYASEWIDRYGSNAQHLLAWKTSVVSDSNGAYRDISFSLFHKWAWASGDSFSALIARRDGPPNNLAFIKKGLYNNFSSMMIPNTSTLDMTDVSYFPSDTTIIERMSESTPPMPLSISSFKFPPHSSGWYTISIRSSVVNIFALDTTVPSTASLISSTLLDLNTTTVTSTSVPSMSLVVHPLSERVNVRFQALNESGEPVPWAPIALHINGMDGPTYYVTDMNGLHDFTVYYNDAYANKYVPIVITNYSRNDILAQLSIPWFAGGVLPSYSNTLKISSETNSKLITTYFSGTAARLKVSGGTPGKSFIIKNVTKNLTLWNGVFDVDGKAFVYITNRSSLPWSNNNAINYSVESQGNIANYQITWINRANFKIFTTDINQGNQDRSVFSSEISDLNNIRLSTAFFNEYNQPFQGMYLTFYVVNNTTGAYQPTWPNTTIPVGDLVYGVDTSFEPLKVFYYAGSGVFELPPAWRTKFASSPGTYNIVATAAFNSMWMPWMFTLEKPLVFLPPLIKSSIVSAATNATTPMVMTGINISDLLTSASPAIAKYVNKDSATVVVPAINTNGSKNFNGFVDSIPVGGVLYIPSVPGDTYTIQYNQYTIVYEHLQNGNDKITVTSPGGTTQNFNPVPVGGSYYVGTQRFVRIGGGSSFYAADYDVVCFLANAPVLTPSGYKEIGSLKAGDLVMTADGSSSPITKVNVQHVNPCSETNPYSIPKGQFGATRRLLISPNHKVLVAGRGLVEARKLGLEQKSMTKSFEYYNLELESWKNMVVAGVIVESLAPKRRFVLSAEEFRTLVLRNFGRITPEVQQRLREVSRVLADGRVEFIATAQR